jgi:hypothetical protein
MEHFGSQAPRPFIVKSDAADSDQGCEQLKSKIRNELQSFRPVNANSGFAFECAGWFANDLDNE